ncbi:MULTISPECIES: hypothetical protein [unclassified Pseudarthrobacter]|uniref:hypothetical protein n=1 Tax=unclassified Pseudarthrobacter TaxID=2647000 RepID=UPI0030775E68
MDTLLNVIDRFGAILYGVLASAVSLAFILPSTLNSLDHARSAAPDFSGWRGTLTQPDALWTARPSQQLEQVADFAGWPWLHEQVHMIADYLAVPPRHEAIVTVASAGTFIGLSVYVWLFAKTTSPQIWRPLALTLICLSILAEVNEPAWPLLVAAMCVSIGAVLLAATIHRFGIGGQLGAHVVEVVGFFWLYLIFSMMIGWIYAVARLLGGLGWSERR